MAQESLYVNAGEHQLHLRHIQKNPNGQPILMIHGSIENGRIFYNEKNRGLGCFLASQGFDVYVLDFRGRGKSTPSIKENADHGYYESIMEDIPLAADYVFAKTGRKLHVICHSWGGVLFHSSFLRFSALRNQVVSTLCFGTKRRVSVWNTERILKLSLFWRRIAPLITRRFGYLDSVKYKVGADMETHQSIQQSLAWLKPSSWIDPVDGFDYDVETKKVEWPPTWHITGSKDKVLGHTQDVKLFISESNPTATFTEASRLNGNKLDYDHINILTDKLAQTDHFPSISQWLKSL